MIVSAQGEVDRVFSCESGVVTETQPFCFDETVAAVFDDMISRSVPGYLQVMSATVEWTHRFFQPGSRVVDIGCSTGTFLQACAQILPADAVLTGVDTSSAMLERARLKVGSVGRGHVIELVEGDATEIAFSRSSVVVCNYTLQFFSKAIRSSLLARIFQEMVPGGVFVLSDKIHFPQPSLQSWVTEAHERFKERQGYSRDEITRKRAALDNVLVTMSFDEQLELVRGAGFSAQPVMQWGNFLTIVGIKEA